MAKQYKNPPIIEALCEFRFIPSQEWDLTIPGLIYEKVKKLFPMREQQLGIGFKLDKSEKGINYQIEPGPPRIQFFKKNKETLIQLSPNLLSINQLKPYQSWKKFKPMILDSFQKYKEVSNPKDFQRIGLRYINRIDIDSVSIEFEKYFNLSFRIPEKLPQDYNDFFIRIQIPYSGGRDSMIISMSSIDPIKPKSLSMILDLDYIMHIPSAINFEKVPAWIEEAHSRVEEVFEACITDRTRTLFQ